MSETEVLAPEQTKSRFKIKITPRGVAKFVVASSIRFVVTSTLTALVPVDSKTEKVKLAVGSFVLSELLAEAAKNYIDGEIDDLTEVMDTAMNQLKTAQQSETETSVHNITTL